jgi:hypothetical protein
VGPPAPPLPGRTVYRLLFLLAALDQLGWGLWALLAPDGLLAFLRLPPLPVELPPDRLLLARVLGGLALAHVGFLAILLWRPERWGSFALVPLLGRALGTGLWLWVYGSDRLHVPAGPPLLLAAHDGVWLPVFAWFLIAWYRRAARETA